MVEQEYYPDYHEHNDFGPAMLALSHFIINWNWVEHYFNVVLWHYAGDIQVGAMYTAGLGNQSRADTLLVLSKAKEKNPLILDFTEFSVSVFGKLKSNRNSLAHSHSIARDINEEKPRWIRSSNNPKSSHVYVYADLDDIVENLNACGALSKNLLELSLIQMGKGNTALLTKFPVPKVLLPHSVAYGNE
ncbi:hypothetical protein GCM10011273_05560 [Asticcacaulis endophyticus]|uniref:Uncharacterized protein n=2 Tax=Asticcacaulis endophyticus TaxID=1395890 RepID=A0A918UNT7_9CAUL|nr:hypothetical protein GCM10011273_05560 [Asticcacaulis endophyticus]